MDQGVAQQGVPMCGVSLGAHSQSMAVQESRMGWATGR